MPVSIVLELKWNPTSAVPAHIGRAVHAWFFSLIHRVDPTCADRLHSMQDEPFTLSSSLGWAAFTTKKSSHPSDQGHWLRVTSLDDELSRLFSELKASSIDPIRLRDAELEVIDIHRYSREHTWANQSTFEELYNNGVARAHQEKRKLDMEFVSPATFRLAKSRMSMPLPWPRLVFQSLESKWNAFSPIPLCIDWPAFEQLVAVARHRLETRMLDFGPYRQVGFVGDCQYIIDRRAKLRLLQSLHTMADYAFYAGVGAKTTMGMGLTRRIE